MIYINCSKKNSFKRKVTIFLLISTGTSKNFVALSPSSPSLINNTTFIPQIGIPTIVTILSFCWFDSDSVYFVQYSLLLLPPFWLLVVHLLALEYHNLPGRVSNSNLIKSPFLVICCSSQDNYQETFCSLSTNHIRYVYLLYRISIYCVVLRYCVCMRYSIAM